MNDTGSRISNRFCTKPVYLCVLVSFGAQSVIAPVVAFADVPPPPPKIDHKFNSGFPSEQALKRQGYDSKTGVLRVNETSNGKSKVSKQGESIVGEQAKRATVTGNYGEKAVIDTSVRQSAAIGRLNTAANALMVANLASNGFDASKSYAESLRNDIRNGDYASAAYNGALTGGFFIDGMSGGLLSKASEIGGIMIGLRTSKNDIDNLVKYSNDAIAKAKTAQSQAERNGDYAGALAQAAAAKAAGAAAEAMKQQEQAKKSDDEAKQKGLIKYQLVVNAGGNITNYPFYSTSGGLNIGGSVFNDNNRPHYFHDYQSKVRIDLTKYSTPQYIDIPTPSDKFVRVFWNSYKEGEKGYSETNTTNLKAEDFTLNQKEMLNILQKMLQNNQTNHAELMNQLSKMGIAQQASESPSYTPASALSAPYTPQGGDMAQQTKFSVDEHGNVTAQTIARPDLKPNSSQAPTRSTVTPDAPKTPSDKPTGDNPTTPTNPIAQNQQNQDGQNDFCKTNPNSAVCQELGNDDYEDIDIPKETIDLNLKPLDVFRTDGVCPAPVSINMGGLGSIDFSYDGLCNVLRLLRPILILGTVLVGGFFAYNAVKEL